MRNLLSSILICAFFFLVFISSCNDHDSGNSNKSLIVKADEQNKEESFEYFLFKNLIEDFPYDNTNTSNYYREFLKSRNQENHQSLYRSLPNWESIGPSNIAGRTLCLALNPLDTNQLWMGSAGAGLWKSNSGGLGANAWQYVATGYPVISVSSIAIQEDNPQVIYIGTGEIYNLAGSDGGIQTRTLRGSKGIGILKSTDGGLHWQLVMDWSGNNQTAVWKIIIHPIHPEIIFAATNSGVYKSTDGGTNWNHVLDMPLVMDMMMDHQEPNILYAGIGGINNTHYGVYKSIDDGVHWNLIQTGNDTIYHGRIMLANYKSNPKRVYAIYSDDFKTIGMLRSKNGFDSSNFYIPIKDVSEHQGWYAKCFHIKDDDSSRMIIGGVDLYLDTTGTGNQIFNLLYWKIRIHADMHDIVSNPKDPNKIYIATDGGLYRSNDFGRTMFSCNQGYLSAQFYTGNISKKSKHVIGGLQDNKSALYFNSNSWTNFHQADGTFNAFDPINDSTIYVSSQYQNLYVSTDFGFKWKELIKPNLSSSFVSPFIIHPQEPQKIISGGHYLLISYDAGQSWDTTRLPDQNESIVALETDATHSNSLYVSTLNPQTGESRLYHLNDGGSGLQLKDNGIPERFIRDIAMDPSNSNTLYLALGGFSKAGFMYSNDSGNSWFFSENKGLPEVPMHSILVDPKDNDIIYIGSEFGLYVSFDKGKTWHSYNAHPYDLIPVYDIKYSPLEDKLFLFTHGFGAFRCALLDKTVVTNTETLGISQWNLLLKDDYIILPESLDCINSLTLVNIEGKRFTLRKQNNEFKINSLQSGVYFVITDHSKLNRNRIVILR